VSEADPTVLDSRLPSRRYLTMVVASLSLIALTSVAVLVPVPYVILTPGPTFNTLGSYEDVPMFTFGEGAKTYPTRGELRFTSVSATGPSSRISLLEALIAHFTEDTAVRPRSSIYPDENSAKENRARDRALMTVSQIASRVAGLRAAGYDISTSEIPTAPVVHSVLSGAASDGRLRSGDVLRNIDGKPVRTAKDVVAAIGRVDPGDDVDLVISRDGKSQEVTVVTRPSPEDPASPAIGIKVRVEPDLPVDITNHVDAERIGGSSAGLMFSLAIYDRLTPGALTGGMTVAGTGTIDLAGSVGPIGGIRQKIAGAADGGAKIFLVPAANCAEAADGDHHGMRLIEVSTLDDAIGTLEKLAKDRQARVPQCR
jgi:PDZ domain-containing protein